MGDDDEDTAVSRSVSALIAYDGRPCVIVAEMETEYEGEGEERMGYSTVEGVWLCEVTLEDGKAAVGEELTELDWFDLVQGGDSEYLNQCDLPTVVGDTLYFASYDESSMRVLVATDLTDGDTDVYYPADLGADISLDSFCAYKDGQLLVMETEWGEEESAVKLYAFDVENEEATELLTLATGESISAIGLAYRADTDTIYCIMNGEICAMTGLDASALQRVAEIPISYIGSAAPIVTEDGFYIAADYAALVRRNTDPAQARPGAHHRAGHGRQRHHRGLLRLWRDPRRCGSGHAPAHGRRGAGDDEPLDGRGRLLRERRFRGVRRRLFARLHGRADGKRSHLRVP